VKRGNTDSIDVYTETVFFAETTATVLLPVQNQYKDEK